MPVENRGDICQRCTKITLAHVSFCYSCFLLFDVQIIGKRLKFRIVIHWFLRLRDAHKILLLKSNFDLIDGKSIVWCITVSNFRKFA